MGGWWEGGSGGSGRREPPLIGRSRFLAGGGSGVKNPERKKFIPKGVKGLGGSAFRWNPKAEWRKEGPGGGGGVSLEMHTLIVAMIHGL